MERKQCIQVRILNEGYLICSLPGTKTPGQCFDWPTINKKFRDSCPSILGVINLLLSLPVTSAEAEHGFSKLKAIKTENCTRLSDSSLSDQLMVALESPDIKQFDPDEAIHLWNIAGPRGRRLKGYSSTKKQSQQVDKDNDGADSDDSINSECSSCCSCLSLTTVSELSSSEIVEVDSGL